MTGPLYAIGRLCVRFRFVVVAVWVIAAIGLAVGASSVGNHTNDNLNLPGTDSQNAQDLLAGKFPEQANGTNPVVFEAPSGQKVTDSKFRTVVDQVIDDYRKDSRVQDAGSPYSSDNADQLTKGQTIAYISLNLKDSSSELDENEAESLIAKADPMRNAGLKVAEGGYLGKEVSKSSTHASEVIGLVAAVIILLFTFGTFVAMGLPILTAVVGLVGGLSAITLISTAVDVPTSAPALATMIGLGVGIDYALFIVTRHRHSLQEGIEVHESIARATATAGGAVAFAGGTVIIALCSLFLAGVPLVSTLGFTAALVVLIAMVAAVTLLPAILGILGLKINALKLPGMRIHHDAKPHGWARFARFVADRPWPAMAFSVVVLLLHDAPVLGLHLGQSNTGALPTDTTARQAYDLMTKGFGAGSNGPLLVADALDPKATNDQKSLDDLEDQQKQQEDKQKDDAEKQTQDLTQQLIGEGVPPDQAQEQATQQVQEQTDEQNNSADAQQQQQSYDEQKAFLESTASDPRLQDLRDDMDKTKGVKSTTQPLVNDAGTAAVFNVTSDSAPSDRKTQDVVNTLRDDTIPKAVKGQGETVYVGGSTAGYIDLADEIGQKLPLVIGVVLLLSFLLLMLAFRSLL